MFQRGTPRKSADDKHLCGKCKNSNECKFKPDPTTWRWVLDFCQIYNEEVNK